MRHQQRSANTDNDDSSSCNSYPFLSISKPCSIEEFSEFMQFHSSEDRIITQHQRELVFETRRRQQCLVTFKDHRWFESRYQLKLQ